MPSLDGASVQSPVGNRRCVHATRGNACAARVVCWVVQLVGHLARPGQVRCRHHWRGLRRLPHLPFIRLLPFSIPDPSLCTTQRENRCRNTEILLSAPW